MGVAWDIDDGISLKVDYFQLNIDNVIQTKSVQRLFDEEDAGVLVAIGPDDETEDRFYLKRSATGKLIEAGTGYTNGIGFNIEGLDITFNAFAKTEFGEFSFNVVNSLTLSYEEERGLQIVDTAGWSGQPDFKSVGTFAWSIGDHSVAWNFNYIAKTTENESLDRSEPIFANRNWETDGKLDSWLIHNLTYVYSTDSYGSLMFTIANLLDEDPILNSTGAFDDPNLYNQYGRDFRVNYKFKF